MKKGHHRTTPRGDRRGPIKAPPPPPPRVIIPHRVQQPQLPQPSLLPTKGHWLWTCREGFEAALYEELCWQKARATLLGAGLVETEKLPPNAPTFARMGFKVEAVVKTPQEAARVIKDKTAVLQVWVPDTQVANARASETLAWEATIAAAREGLKDPATPWAAFQGGTFLAQVCLVAPHTAAVGAIRAREALSLAPGGRARMKRTADAPSRAAMKLDEALEWVGVSPGRSDLCVDLGSAPGGWTRRLMERGARVISVDPGVLADDLMTHGRIKHFQQSAFSFEPEQPADWLFCDMAWRPLEVAQLIAKWGRHGWATQVVANIKLPMKDVLPMLLKVRAALENGGWRSIAMRQLYHDRDEITLRAVRAAQGH